ncbi:MAG: isoaspartyl peptidase/L-asparaginase [Bacteroidia bacterium]|nr:isoaspartyl peptidase/L-asparaginase [Bacteroidia bacterium]NNF30060.1 isoaspartyl peptidase/L-asparaginase [Flavobacteriaceae bacterium]MBT8274554.1 isoaspartyl peptidase/L-asparaginase [Bacteroidia bacterium]NNJ81880.1 isoaspartyl peptidase/L-asparaginase [Flavobacteriaceae bacterium]NNK53983.1 isoaspartyl peptidase/L-asparaginase [Flavobacteriaceae bacterium]
MTKIFSFLFTVVLVFSCGNDKNVAENASTSSEKTSGKNPTFGLVIHGGAGTILKENMSDSLEAAYTSKLEEAIRVGHKILENGGSAMEAVTKTINVMEDSPLFNAGKGAVFTHDETNELDASVMDGATLNAGAVAGVTGIKNPIDLAVEVMNNSPHVMLSGKGAEIFAKERGIELVDPSYFYTERRFQSLKRIKEREKENKISVANEDTFIKNSKYGTVGCAALDKNGNLAAGTSTGGMTNKKWNRIGDAPIIGAGTYANNATCAVSSTGWGEYFIRAMVAHDISAMMEYKGVSLQDAASDVIQKKLSELGGTGGIVAIDKDGNISMEFNTAGMYRAHMNAQGELTIGIYKE